MQQFLKNFSQKAHALYLPIFLAPLVLFSDHIFNRKALFWGTASLQFFPWWTYAWGILLKGEIPLWNSLSGMGAPLIANYQTAVFYPPYWFGILAYLIGGVSLMAWIHTILVCVHLIFAGFGMALLLRELRLGITAQMVGALCFSMGGYLVSRAGFLSINAAAAWFPWICFLLYKMVSEGKTKQILFTGIGLGFLFLAGHAQTAWYIVLFSVLWIGWLSWTKSAARGGDKFLGRVGKNMLRLSAAGVVGISIAAVQLLPTVQYLLMSQRAGEVAYETAMTYSYWPWRFLTLVAPGLFGTPAQGNYWGYGNYWEDAVYVGVLPLILGIIVICKNIFQRKRHGTDQNLKYQKQQQVVFFFWISVVSFLLALGKNTPLFPFLYKYIPTFDLFQAPTRFTIWAQLSLSVLAGIGIDQWRKPAKRQLYWTRLAAAGCFAVAFGAWITSLLLGDIKPTFIMATAKAGIFGLFTALMSLLMPSETKQLRRFSWMGGVVLVVIVDLVLAGWGLNPGVDLSFYSFQPDRQDLIGRIYMSPELEYEIKFNQYFRFDTFFPNRDWEELRQTYLPNLHLFEGLNSVNNFDPILPDRYQAWMEAFENARDSREHQLLSMMGIGTVIKQDLEGGISYDKVSTGRPQLVRYVGCVMYVSSEKDAFDAVFHGSINLDEVVIIEADFQALPEDCLGQTGSVKVVNQTANSITIEADSELPGYILWSQAWYPGWVGTVDGQLTPVRRANYLFQALPVESGNHIITFRYRPLVFWVGLSITFTASGGIIAIFLFQRKQKQKQKIQG